jgi:rod shape-determining protein MreC
MFRKTHYILIGLVVLLALVLLNLPDRTLTQLKLAVSSLFVPFFGVAASGDRLVAKMGDNIMPRADLERELQLLRRDNQQLRIHLMQTQELARENSRLRQSLGWRQQTQWQLRLARVISRDPANWWRTIQIDLGLRDGIRSNLPVLTPEGLVGRTAEVGQNRAVVVLLGDPKCRVAAAIPEAQDTGIIAPGAANSAYSPFIDLSFLSRGNDLRAGQQVTTSGLGGTFPRGIHIGQIVDTHSMDGLYIEARIKLAAGLNNLEEVWVLLP